MERESWRCVVDSSKGALTSIREGGHAGEPMRSVLLSLCLIASLGAQEGAESAQALVKKAIAFYKQNGRPALVQEVTSKGGSLRQGTLYVFVYDMDGVVVAHGQLVTLIGKNLANSKDPKGKLWVQERLEIARTKGSGWQDYDFLNPVNKKWEPKRAYIEKADDLIFGCGTYRP